MMRGILRLLGWKVVGELPEDKKAVIIFAPHTSNWDFVLMMMTRYCFAFNAAFLGKHTLFKAPFGWIFRWFGGIPVERSKAHNVVDNVAEVIKQRESVHLAIAPEGTRSKTKKWKSGFYHIALKAEVPVILTFLDTKTRTLGIGPTLHLTGSIQQDVEFFKEFYQDKHGIREELASDVRIEERD